MGSRFLGYLTDHRLALYDIRPAGWTLVKEFDKSEAHELPDYLNRNKPLHLLADLVEMEFRFEKATALRGSDRRAFHHRKLQQTFRNSPFRHVFPLGREPGRRGEERILLSAITNPDLVTPWTAPLRLRCLPLSGIASVPVLQEPLAHCLATDNPHLLLVTAQDRVGIRITYFFQREMRFSRLAGFPEVADHLGQTAFEEVIRTHQYLLSLRLVERNSPVDVACLLPERLLAPWSSLQPPAGALHFRHIGLHEVGQRAGIKSPRASDSAEALFIALLLKAGFPNHFAPVEERRYHHLLQARRGLLAASGLVAAAVLATTATQIHGTLEKIRDTRETEATVAALNVQAEDIRKSFPKTRVPATEMREALTLTRSLSQEHAPSRKLLADISRGLDAVPQAELNRLSWVHTDKPENLSSESRIADTKDPAPSSAEKRLQPLRWTAVVSGNIVGAGDYRQANAATDALRDAIRREGIQVDVLRYPLHVHSDSQLNEDFGDSVPSRLPFLIRVLWKE